MFRDGKSFSNYPFKIIYSVAYIGYAPLQAGFAVSKKNFKKASDRNRVKRLMKEGFRLQKSALKEKLNHNKKYMTVFFIYSGKVLPEHKIVVEKILLALNRLEKIADESAPSIS